MNWVWIGVQLFFGFVLGAVLLWGFLATIPIVFRVVRAIFRGIFAAFKKLGHWIEEYSRWIAATVLYCWMAFAMSASDKPWEILTGTLMLVALGVSLLILFWWASNHARWAKQKKAKAEK